MKNTIISKKLILTMLAAWGLQINASQPQTIAQSAAAQQIPTVRAVVSLPSAKTKATTGDISVDQFFLKISATRKPSF